MSHCRGGVEGGASPGYTPLPRNTSEPGPPTTPGPTEGVVQPDDPTNQSIVTGSRTIAEPQPDNASSCSRDQTEATKETGEGPRVVKLKFYEKETGSPLTVLETSACSWQSKVSILTQEVTRRLINTSEDLPQQTKDEIMNRYCSKLKNSGYSNRQSQK